MSTSSSGKTTVAEGGTVKRRGLTDVVYHVFDTPGRHTFTVSYRIPRVEYLVVGATGGGVTPGGGGEVVKGATAGALEPGEYVIEVGEIGGKVETKVTMVNCMQNADTCKQTRYTQYMNFPNGAYNGVPSGTYLSCDNIRSTPTKMTEDIYAAGGQSSFMKNVAKGGQPGALKPYMVSRWQETMGRYGGRVPGSSITMSAAYPRNQFEYAFPNYSYNSDGKTHGVNPLYTSWSCGQFNMSYIAGASATGKAGTRYENCCAWAGQPQDLNCCTNASGGAGGDARRPSTGKAEPGAGIMSNITGENVEYGHGSGGNVNAKPAKHGVVIIAYNLKSAEANIGPSPDEIATIVKEYERKMAEYRAQVDAEKKAMMDQNQAAVSAAKAEQEKLITELTSLKTRYDQLQQTAQTTETTLQSTQQQLVALNAEYTQKMQDLETARQAEIKALTDQNQTAVAAAKAEQEKLVAELTALKTTYDALVSKSAECPIIPEGTTLVDGGTGQMYKAEKGVLRPLSMDVYRSMGSPAYTTYPSGSLDQCSTGPPYIIPTTTPVPSTTAAPSTDPQFPGTLYVILHADSWLKDKQLKVLASRFGSLEVEAFQFKALEQVFVINNTGYIRSVAGDGLYLTSAGDCLSPVMSKEAPLSPWRISRTGTSPLEYTLVSSCGASLKATLGAQAAILEEGVFGSEVSENWYIVPVGRAQM
jgi:hypothetical protein